MTEEMIHAITVGEEMSRHSFSAASPRGFEGKGRLFPVVGLPGSVKAEIVETDAGEWSFSLHGEDIHLFRSTADQPHSRPIYLSGKEALAALKRRLITIFVR